MDKNQTKLVENLQRALGALKQGDVYVSNGLEITREEVFQHAFLLTGDSNLLSDGATTKNAEDALNNYSQTLEAVGSVSTTPYEKDELLDRNLGINNESQISALNTVYEAPTEPEYQPLSDLQIRSDFQSSLREAYAETFQQFKNPASGDNMFSSALEHGELKQNINMVRDEIFGRAKSKVMDKLKSKAMSSTAGKTAQAAANKMLSKIGSSAVGKVATQLAAKAGLSAAAAGASGGASLLIQGALMAAGKIKDLGAKLLSKLGIGFKKWNIKKSDLLAAGAITLGVASVAVPTAMVGAVGLGAAAFWGGGTAAFAGGVSLIVGGIAAVFTAFVSIAVVPIVVTMISLPLLVAFMIFVITASSYVTESAPAIPFVDTGEPGSQPGRGGLYPACWPAHGQISQGPYCSGFDPTWSHCEWQLNAIDIAGDHGSYIYATHDGRVTVRTGTSSDYGDYVIITSPLGFQTLYGHLLNIYVSSGDNVLAGDLIASMNGDPNDFNPGASDGVHLHYEIRGLDGSINNYVPSYELLGYTGPCYAEEEGGSITLPAGTGDDCQILASNARTIAGALSLHPNPVTDSNGYVYNHGLWDYWNYNTRYLNQYWNEDYYQSNPTQNASACATCIFWCTALITEAYNSSGFSFPSFMSVAYVGNMQNEFDRLHRYFSASRLPASEVPVGSAIFFGNHHVAMILGINGQIVTIAESNSYPPGHPYDDPGTGDPGSPYQGRNPINTSRVGIVGNRIVALQGNYEVTGYGIPPAECN